MKYELQLCNKSKLCFKYIVDEAKMRSKNTNRLSTLSLLFLFNILIYPRSCFAQENNTSDTPTIILIDNSGSMGKCSKTTHQSKCDDIKPYKIDDVKEAIILQSIRSSYQSDDKIDFKIHIVGYKANKKDEQFRDCKSKLPQIVTYETPANKDELVKAVAQTFSQKSNLKENLLLLQVILGCLVSIATLTGYFKLTHKKVTFLVQDEISHKAIKGAKILMMDDDHCTKYTDDNGICTFYLKIKKDKEIKITVSKPNSYEQIDQAIIPSSYPGIIELKLNPIITINPS